MLEKQIESYFKNKIKQLDAFCFKASSPSLSGVSDRVLVYQNCVYFIELKTKKGTLSDHQKYFKQKITQHGGTYIVLNCCDSVDKFFLGLEQKALT